MSLFQASQQWSTMSSKDLKIRFESQLSRMNCQPFSCGFSSGALDPLSEDGAVARFLKSLRDELKGADEDRAKQLASALNALDANDQHSLINRLVRETNTAR